MNADIQYACIWNILKAESTERQSWRVSLHINDIQQMPLLRVTYVYLILDNWEIKSLPQWPSNGSLVILGFELTTIQLAV